MINFVDIRNYQPTRMDRFLFDTNIWMYLFCPLGNYRQVVVRNYSNFLKRILQTNSTIFLPAIVISEFSNAYLRLEYNLLKEKNPSAYSRFKIDFRMAEIGRNKMQEIVHIFKSNISKMTIPLDDGFSSIPLDNLFENISDLDFNDALLLEIAARNDLKIVTDDSDFANVRHVEIFTSNPKMLS